MQLTSAVSCIEFTPREWDIHDAAYMAGYRAAREDAAAEDKQRKRVRELKQAIKRQRAICTIKQRAIGLAMLVLGLAIPYIMDGDATASLLIIPLGLYTTFTRELIIYDSSVEKLQELKKELREGREVAQW